MTNIKHFFISALLLIILTGLSACGGGGGGGSSSSPPPPPPTGMSTITGVIVDSRGNPVPHARISITGKPVTTTTNEFGFFTITLESGDYTLTVSRNNEVITEKTLSVTGSDPISLDNIKPSRPYFPWYADNDGDGYGDSNNVINSKTHPSGNYAVLYGDCDDTNPKLNPETVWHKDGDGDGYYASNGKRVQCLAPAKNYTPTYLITVYDCNDSNKNVNPGASEIPGNNIDDDCDSYSTDFAPFSSDKLAGKYRTTSITVGDAINGDWIGWEKGDLTITGNGTISDYLTKLSDGTTEDTPSLTYQGNLLPSGLITFTSPLQATGNMSLNEQNISVLSPDEGTALSLTILQRKVDNIALDDLAGNWSFYALAIRDGVGNGYALNGSYTIDPDGSVITKINDGDTSYFSDMDIFLMDAYGKAIKGDYWSEVYTLSSDHNLLAGTYTNSDYYHVIDLAVKSDGSYQTSDMQGDWFFNVLTTGEDLTHNAMGHGVLRLSGGGEGKVLYQAWSSPVLKLADGQFQISNSGKISHAKQAGLHGQLSPDHNLFIATYGEMPGPMGLLVAQRRQAPPTMIIADETRKATASIGLDGGKLETMAQDGTAYSLNIPPGALLEDTLISIAPSDRIEGRLPEGELLGLLQFEPDGLLLQLPATLTITPPVTSTSTEPLGFNYEGRAADRFGFQPVRKITTGALELDILHFSGTGGTFSNPSNQPDPDAAYESQINYIVSTAMANGLSPFDPDVRAALEALFENWIASSLTPRAAIAPDLDAMEILIGKLLSMAEVWQTLGFDEGDLCPIASSANLVDTINTRSDELLQQLDQSCLQQPACGQRSIVQQALRYVARMQLLGGACGFNNPAVESIYPFCDSFLLSNGVFGTVTPAISNVDINKSLTLNADTTNILGEPAGHIVFWKSLAQGIASITNQNESSAGVTGYKTGLASIIATTDACVEIPANVFVAPPLNGTWSVEPTERIFVKQSAACTSLNLPEPYTVEINATGSSLNYPGATLLNWSGGSVVLRPENMLGDWLGHTIKLKGNASWPEAGMDPVARECNFIYWPKTPDSPATVEGSCSFEWTGTYIPGTGYTGCYGTDRVTAIRVLPP